MLWICLFDSFKALEQAGIFLKKLRIDLECFGNNIECCGLLACSSEREGWCLARSVELRSVEIHL